MTWFVTLAQNSFLQELTKTIKKQCFNSVLKRTYLNYFSASNNVLDEVCKASREFAEKRWVQISRAKQNKTSISTRVVTHLICGLRLEAYRAETSTADINVWARTVGDCLVGQRVLPHRLTGNHYRDFLPRDLPKLLGKVSLAVGARRWYMHDGVPAQCICAVRGVLNMADG